MKTGNELNIALTDNLRLKSRILGFIFSAVFGIQVVMIIYFFSSQNNILAAVPTPILFCGPAMILLIASSEFLFARQLGRSKKNGGSIPAWMPYLVTIVETSFPTFFLVFAAQFLHTQHYLTGLQLATSPPLILYVILVSLSSLMLDFRISVVAGLAAALQYFFAARQLVHLSPGANSIDEMNVVFRSLMIFVCGLVAGFISRKTREAVNASMESKNILITKLDSLVAEKTAEVIRQKDEIQEKSQEITDSINYAKRLQEAILPPLGSFTGSFTDSFVLYLPKDIVAGDFYWLEEYEGKIYLAVADCTGHGVPGALVSVVCSGALNRALMEFRITEPGAILDKVRELVMETFSRNANDVQDGMDISLVRIDAQRKEISWAAANNPAWLVRKGELIELEHDRQPVGKSDYSRPFTSRSMPLETGDMLYLASDGYADQFGGEKGKKFKTAALKRLLLTLSGEKGGKQHSLLMSGFADWKGKLGQVDDVCIVGVRV